MIDCSPTSPTSHASDAGCYAGPGASSSQGRASPVLARNSRTAVSRAADIFRVLGDFSRLYTLELLLEGERCVSTLAAQLGDNLPAVSQRLKLFRSAGLVARRRAGRHVFYRLADDHVRELLSNALAHAAELAQKQALLDSEQAAFPHEIASTPRSPSNTVLS